MNIHTIDYLAEEDAPPRWRLLNRGFWLHNIPRPLLLCRTLGHKPIVDGADAARWVACDRCGVRPNPQGSLDPAEWNIGDAYTGPWGTDAAHTRPLPTPSHALPGPWPSNPTWTLGGQIILGSNIPGASIEAKVGNCASEHVLEAHARLNPLGAVYLHTERLGTWLQRRLNPVGYESRVVSVDIAHGRLTWMLWAKRNSWSRNDPRWQRGSVRLNPLTRLLGETRYWYTNQGEPTTVTVRLPHGDDHTVKLQLQRCDYGRPKGRRRFHSWAVDWDCRPGIPTKPGDRGLVLGSGVEVSAAAVREGTWPQEASSAIAHQITQDRTRYGLHTVAEVA